MKQLDCIGDLKINCQQRVCFYQKSQSSKSARNENQHNLE